MGVHGEFIELMQQKYRGYTGNGIEDVPIAATLPEEMRSRGRPGQTAMAPGGKPMGGTRYMGRGDNNVVEQEKPAGIVEEGEQVIEADMVKDAGGPENIRNSVEKLAMMKAQGVKSYQTGTGSDTVPPPTRNTDLGLEEDSSEITEGMTDRGPSRFSDYTKTGMEGLKKMAAGDSETMNMVSDVQERKLAGQQAARSSAVSQGLAQAGVEGGAARVADAMEQRRAGMEQSDLKSNLAIEEQQRMERANDKLAQYGLQGENFEEYRHQFDVNTKKWGEEFAMANIKYNYNTRKDGINAMLAAGDLEGAQAAYSDLGIDIDMSYMQTLQDEETFNREQKRINSAMDGFTSSAATFGADSPQASQYLEAAYQATNPDADISTPEGKKSMNDWVSQSQERYAIKTDPIRSVMESIAPDVLDSMFVGYGVEDMENFEFNGAKGEEAARDWLTAAMMGPNPALPVDENGLGTPNRNNPLWDAIDNHGKTEEEIAAEKATAETEKAAAEAKTTVESMYTNEDFSSLSTMGPGDPAYDEVLKRTPPFDVGGYYETSGNNQQNFNSAPPAVGTPININGRIYIVDSDVKMDYTGGTGSGLISEEKKNENQYFIIRDPKSNKTYRIIPGGTKGKSGDEVPGAES